jgi:hypothetical protein
MRAVEIQKMSSGFSLPLNIYANGGGTTTAAIFGGQLCRIQDHYVKQYGSVDFRGSNFILSSAAFPAAMTLAVSQITGRPISEIAQRMQQDVHNKVLLNNGTAILKGLGKAIRHQSSTHFNLWTRENYAAALAGAFSHNDGRPITLRDLLECGINFSIMFTLHDTNTGERRPFILPLSKWLIYNKIEEGETVRYELRENVDPAVLDTDIGTISGVAMSHPWLLRSVEDFLAQFGIYLGKGIKVIDGDLLPDNEEHEHISPSAWAITALIEQGAEAIHWFMAESDSYKTPVLKMVAQHMFKMLAGVDSISKSLSDRTQEMLQVPIAKHFIKAPRNIPIRFANTRELFEFGYTFMGERLQYFPGAFAENPELKLR